MKILVFSDSHGQTRLMSEIVGNFKDELGGIIFLGDYVRDCLKLQQLHPHLKYHMVAGNCDFMSPAPEEALIELAGIKIFLTHGHLHGIKGGYYRIVAHAAKIGANACFFGHSHVPAHFQKNGITFLNPGSITEPRGHLGKSYAVAEIVGGTISIQIVEV
ncbi:MAG: metallophosphoesterase [Clostridiales bacterium]|jgi:putative phosphoesterase|nr:metallophosphoesterase [Clostridiales bacterium]